MNVWPWFIVHWLGYIFDLLIWVVYVVIISEVVAEVEWDVDWVIAASSSNAILFNDDDFRVSGCRDWTNDNWDEVLIYRWLVFPLDCIWISKVVIVELNITLIVEMTVVKSWAAQVVLNVEVFPLVEIALGVNVIEIGDWTVVFMRDFVLKSSVLDSWLNLIGVGLLVWIIYINVVWLEFISIMISVLSVVIEVLMLVNRESMWVETEITVNVAVATMLIEISIYSVTKRIAGLAVEVI